MIIEQQVLGSWLCLFKMVGNWSFWYCFTRLIFFSDNLGNSLNYLILVDVAPSATSAKKIIIFRSICGFLIKSWVIEVSIFELFNIGKMKQLVCILDSNTWCVMITVSDINLIAIYYSPLIFRKFVFILWSACRKKITSYDSWIIKTAPGGKWVWRLLC